MIVVSDNSVLCYLAQLGKLDLLEQLFGVVVMPAEVLAECTHANAPELLRLALNGVLPGFIRVQNVNHRLPETSSLDLGEAAAISLAWEHRPDALLLIDERSGRAIAQALGLRVRGLLALLADGHRQQLLDFDPCVEALGQHGFRSSSVLLQTFRRELRLPEST